MVDVFEHIAYNLTYVVCHFSTVIWWILQSQNLFVETPIDVMLLLTDVLLLFTFLSHSHFINLENTQLKGACVRIERDMRWPITTDWHKDACSEKNKC